MLKKFVQVLSFGAVVLSLIFLLYGSVKLYRATQPQSFDTGVPGVEVISPLPLISEQQAQAVMGVSLVFLILSGTTLFVSSKQSFRIDIFTSSKKSFDELSSGEKLKE